jgi:hypothetical protein
MALKETRVFIYILRQTNQMGSRIDDEDADTVVGGPSYPVKYKGLKKSDRIDESYDSSSTHPRKGVSLHDFSKTADYALEERAFFVPIGKDGVITALEKIDKQLRDVSTIVCTSFVLVFTSSTYSPGGQVSCQTR